MQRRKLLRNLIIKFLKEEPGGLTRLALMSLCHGYRYTHQKLLFFSVKERAYLQAYQLKDAEEFLGKMLEEATTFYDLYKVKLAVKEARSKKQLEASKAYDLIEAPKEVVTRPAEKQLVSGNPAFLLRDQGVSQFSTLRFLSDPGLSPSIAKLIELSGGRIANGSAYSGLSESLWAQISGQGVLPDNLEPPQYETIPEERGPSSYAILEAELERKLETYPKVVWQKFESERRFAEDDELMRQVRKEHQATRRALQSLLEDDKITVEGNRAEAIYRLATEPS